MKNLIYLEDLLRQSILDLDSAEAQIIEALPSLIEKASNPALMAALDSHLKTTIRQKQRLEKVKKVLIEKENTPAEKNFFSILLSKVTPEKCLGMEGLIDEGKQLIEKADHSGMIDAVIIGVAQKIEHYEIAAYGTAFEYAKELEMDFIAGELETTLKEEYEADDLLTSIAKGGINNGFSGSQINQKMKEGAGEKSSYDEIGMLGTTNIATVLPEKAGQ